MTFSEALQAKIFDLKGLRQRKNLWLLNEEKIGVAVMAQETPRTKDIWALAHIRDLCQRLIVVVPAKDIDHQTHWAHSTLVDAVAPTDIGIEAILETVQPEMIVAGPDAGHSIPTAYRHKLHQYS